MPSFTGTPLLKKDKQTSLEVFGGYIHTYKFSEGVEDQVVLDLVYEARDIDQSLGSGDKVDAWFGAKTKALNDWQKDKLKKKWGTMRNVLSSKSRMDRVVSDIIFDFSVKPRLSSERGNALRVASSIYEACKYFTLFQKTSFRGKCAVVTSSNPRAKDVTMEEVGANTETDRQFIFNTYTELLKDTEANPGMTKTETYEERAKALFTKEPANMKVLVVMDKLLTGFGAPPCTYLYIDKSMQDHGRVRPGTTDEMKQAIIARWYREQIKAAVPGISVRARLRHGDRSRAARHLRRGGFQGAVSLVDPGVSGAVHCWHVAHRHNQ
jgi:type I restriction enzyme, R subunit